MSVGVVGHVHRNIFAVNGRCGGPHADPRQRSGRDLRLDLFRGLSLFFIFIDHVPDNVLSYLTLQSFSFCDAAEVFIFISGYAAALYVVLLGIFPPVLLLLRRHLALPVMVSGVIYLLTLHFGWQPHSYPDDEAWYFNPLAWQFLFVIGATAGYAPYSRQVLTMPSAWLAKLAIVITVAVAIIHISWTIHEAYEAFPGLLLQELSPLVDDKANLAPLRLVSFLALAVTAGHPVRPAFAASVLPRGPARGARRDPADLRPRRHCDATCD